MAKDVYERLEWRVKRTLKGYHRWEYRPQWCFKFLFFRFWVGATLKNEMDCQYVGNKATIRTTTYIVWYENIKHPTRRVVYEKEEHAMGFIEKYEEWRKEMAELKHDAKSHPFIKA